MAKRVLVTGAASGIGLVIARAFTDDGADVRICDADAAAVAAAQAAGLGAAQVDVADADALDAWVDGAIAELGGIDVLVNNAGSAGPTANIEDVALDDWNRCLAVCLTSHYRTCSRVAPHLKAQRSGVIINLSSTAGLHGFGRRAPYAAAKWGVIGLTKTLAIELGPYGVRVNAICPGPVDGPRIRGVIERDAAVRGEDPAVVERELLAGQSIARFIQPDEIADLCRYLVSDGARTVTGQALAVDGHTEAYHL